MKTILYILITSFCFASAQDLDFKLDDVIITSNDTAKVRLRALNFTDISSMQFSIEWRSEYAELVDVVNFHDETMSISNFNLNFTDDGAAIFLWFHPDGETSTIGDGETIFELIFLPKQLGSTPVIISDEPISMEASRNFSEIKIGNFSGSINIVDASKNNVTFTLHQSKFEGEFYDLPITVSGFTDISSFQASILFNTDDLNLFDGTSDLIDSTNIGFTDDNGLLVSWFNTAGETTTLEDGDTLVVLHFHVSDDGPRVPLTVIVDLGFQSEVSQNFEVVNFVQAHAGIEFDVIAPSVEGEFVYSSIPGLESYLTLYLYYDEALLETPSASGEDSEDVFEVTVSPFVEDENIYVINHTVENFGDVHFYISSTDEAGNNSLDTITINVVQNKAGVAALYVLDKDIHLKTFETNFVDDAMIYTSKAYTDEIFSDHEFLSEKFNIRTSERLQSAMVLSLNSDTDGQLMQYHHASKTWVEVNSYFDDGTIYGEIKGNGTYAFVRTEDIGTTPESFLLEQNYPNPFNPVTNIKINLPVQGHVELVIFNMNGKKIRTLLNESLEAGVKEITWNGTNQSGIRVSSGVYFYMLKYNGNRFSKKMILMK